MIACPTLWNSEVTAWEAKTLHVFKSLQYCCFPYCFCLSCAGVDQGPSTFWSATQSLLVGYQATIPPFEEDTQGFHRTPIAWLSVQLFLHKKCHELLNLGPLVFVILNYRDSLWGRSQVWWICSCCCLPLLSHLACSILSTLELPFRDSLYSQVWCKIQKS